MTRREIDPRDAGGRDSSALLCRFSDRELVSETIVPVVLEFEQPPVAVYKRLHPAADPDRYARELAEIHQEFLQKLASLCMEVQVGRSMVVVAGPRGSEVVSVPHDFTQIFNGMGVQMPGRVVTEVARMSGVRAVTLNTERVYLNLDKSVPFSGAPMAWERWDLADRNLRGQEMVVAVIDTGIDWTHPAFGGFTEVPNEKVIHAVSYTGEHPIDNFGHGTHVAGIIAGDAEYRETPRGDALLNGVAPKAKLMGYKVLSASGSGSATNIILAMEDAVRRGCHVMNLSLGDGYGDPYSPESSAANNAMLAGVIVCIAAGNAGPEPQTVGAPGAAQHVITVGASTDDGVTALVARLDEPGKEPREIEMRMMENSAALPSPALDSQYVECGLGAKPVDFPRQVRRRIALVQRGENTFREKALAAEKAGAIACVIYNNRDGSFFGSLGEYEEMPAIPVVAISRADGEAMLRAIDGKGRPSRAQLQLRPEEIPQPDRMAEFSSRGPSRAMGIKPELTAPGVNIDSATITQAAYPGGGMPDPSGYVSASGTSMATPHVAGAAALLRQAHPQWTSLQITAALVNTARWMAGQGSVTDQGNGAMNLMAALDCKAILVTAATPFSPTHSFGRVGHDGKVRTVTQALTLQPLPGEPDTSTYRLSVELADRPRGLQASLSAGSITCEQTCVASFDLIVTANGAEVADGRYYGFVTAEAEWGTLRLPFLYEATRRPQSEPIVPELPTQGQHRPGQRRVGAMPCA